MDENNKILKDFEKYIAEIEQEDFDKRKRILRVKKISLKELREALDNKQVVVIE